jgi:two-component system phosphate regulon response regulator PhoB
MTGKTVLVIDDEQAVRQMVAFNLEREGYQVRQAADTIAARSQIADVRPDLLLLDWMLPGMSGLEFARALRRESYGQDLPIIMLTARGEEEDMVRGLSVGADDYVTKPFSPRELIARIEAVLRRAGTSAPGDVLELGGLRLDLGSHRVSAGEQTVEVGPTEFRLLHFFMAHPDRVYSRSQLLDRVWGPSVYVEERTVDVHIRRLRKALERHEAAQMVQTVRGSGYRFSARP